MCLCLYFMCHLCRSFPVFHKSITKKMEKLIVLHIILVKLGDWDAANVFQEFKTFYLPVLEKHHKPKNTLFFFSLSLIFFFILL